MQPGAPSRAPRGRQGQGSSCPLAGWSQGHSHGVGPGSHAGGGQGGHRTCLKELFLQTVGRRGPLEMGAGAVTESLPPGVCLSRLSHCSLAPGLREGSARGLGAGGHPTISGEQPQGEARVSVRPRRGSCLAMCGSERKTLLEPRLSGGSVSSDTWSLSTQGACVPVRTPRSHPLMGGCEQSTRRSSPRQLSKALTAHGRR